MSSLTLIQKPDINHITRLIISGFFDYQITNDSLIVTKGAVRHTITFDDEISIDGVVVRDMVLISTILGLLDDIELIEEI